MRTDAIVGSDDAPVKLGSTGGDVSETEVAVVSARTLLEKLVEFVRSGADGREVAEVERDLLRGLIEIGRVLLLAFFRTQSGRDTPTPIPRGDGGTYRHWGWRGRAYLSVFGSVDVERRYYYDHAAKHGITPLDGRLNMPEDEYSHFLMELASGLTAQGPFDQALGTLDRLLGVELSKRPLEEMARRAGSTVPAFYRVLPPPEPSTEGPILVAAVDGKGIPMRKEDRPEPAPSSDPERSGEKKQATVVAVYTIEPNVRTPEQVVDALLDESRPKSTEEKREPAAWTRPRPKNKVVRGTLLGKDVAFEELTRHVEARDPNETKARVFLADGDRSLRLKAKDYLWNFVIVLDIFHALQYVWDAAHVFHAQGSAKARAWVRERLLKVLEGRVLDVVRGIMESATKRGLVGKAKATVLQTAGYLTDNAEFMRYHEYLRRGWPIGSGAVEGACRHLVKDRLEQTGMRWRLKGAEAILQLRSAAINGHFTALWQRYRDTERRRLYGHDASTEPPQRQAA